MKHLLYPGSFDPIHWGHLDVIRRAADLCDRLTVAVAINHSKKSLFSVEERVDFISQLTADISGVQVLGFEGLLVDLFREQKANAVVRGLRAVSDFEYEFQMALMNRSLEDSLETVFLVPSQERIFLSSRIVKEVARLGGDITSHVPPLIQEALREKLGS